MQKHSENALELAHWLDSREEVSWVNYPGLKSSKYADLAAKYLPNGNSGIVTFGLKKDSRPLEKLLKAPRYFRFWPISATPSHLLFILPAPTYSVE